jgi:hypothetical protein
MRTIRVVDVPHAGARMSTSLAVPWRHIEANDDVRGCSPYVLKYLHARTTLNLPVSLLRAAADSAWMLRVFG